MITFGNFNSWESLIIMYGLVINIIGFILYGIDKMKAQKKQWRISEFTLLIISAIGGSIGALIGMVLFKHKLSKPKFYIGIPLFIVVDTVIMIFILNIVNVM